MGFGRALAMERERERERRERELAEGWIKMCFIVCSQDDNTFSNNFIFQMGSKQDLLRKGADTHRAPHRRQMHSHVSSQLYKTLQEGSIYQARKLRFREVM